MFKDILESILGFDCKIECVITGFVSPKIVEIGFNICHFSLEGLGLGFTGVLTYQLGVKNLNSGWSELVG